MAIADRILPLCDLLLGAAYADENFHDMEDEKVRILLRELGGTELSIELETRINAFDPTAFDLAAAAAHFRSDSLEDRKRVLYLVAAVHEADDEIDLAEDEYLRALAVELDVPDENLVGLTFEIVDDIPEHRKTLVAVRKGPPPPPRPGELADVDIDVDLN